TLVSRHQVGVRWSGGKRSNFGSVMAANSGATSAGPVNGDARLRMSLSRDEPHGRTERHSQNHADYAAEPDDEAPQRSREHGDGRGHEHRSPARRSLGSNSQHQTRESAGGEAQRRTPGHAQP